MALDERYLYSERLFNMYVTAVKNPSPDLRSRTYAELIRELLQAHLETNFVGRGLGFARRETKSMLKEISDYNRKRETFVLSYRGSEAKKLTERDEFHWKLLFEKWEKDQDQAISIRSVETELNALKLVARLAKLMVGFTKLRLSSLDDAHLCASVNSLLKIMHNNGYEIDPTTGKLIEATKQIHF